MTVSLINFLKNINFTNNINLKNINYTAVVKDDLYNKHIVQQKQDQMTALSILNKYIKDLAVTGELSKQNIKDARSEQQKILEEIDSIKNNLIPLLEKVEQK